MGCGREVTRVEVSVINRSVCEGRCMRSNQQKGIGTHNLPTKGHGVQGSLCPQGHRQKVGVKRERMDRCEVNCLATSCFVL